MKRNFYKPTTVAGITTLVSRRNSCWITIQQTATTSTPSSVTTVFNNWSGTNVMTGGLNYRLPISYLRRHYGTTGAHFCGLVNRAIKLGQRGVYTLNNGSVVVTIS